MFLPIQKVNHHSNGQQNIASKTNQSFNAKGNKPSEGTTAIRRTIRLEQRDAQNKQQGLLGKGIVDSSLSYADSIRSGRLKSQKTALAVKQVQYNFKSISTKIMRSKTSTSAKQVASQANREVLRLKRMKQNPNSDEEELDAAITHAKAMERLAKKRAAHLEEEELAKVSKVGGPCAGELEEKTEELADKETSEKELDESLSDNMEMASEDVSIETSRMYEELQNNMEELVQNLEEMTDVQTEFIDSFMDEMNETMKDLLEESGLGDLLEELGSSKYEEMDPTDYKMMKIKHRCKELKELAEADSEYLKAIFDQLAKEKDGSGTGLKSSEFSGVGSASISGSPMGMGMPAESGSVPDMQVHIDISL